MANKVVLILSVLLLAVAGAYFLIGSSSDMSGLSAEEYESYREQYEGSSTLPALPSCATLIALSKKEDSIESIDFICADESLRQTFIAELQTQFDWNISFFEPDRVLLTRAVR